MDSLEQELRDHDFSQKDLRLVLSAMDQTEHGLVVLDSPSLNITAVNKGFIDITGYSREQAVGSSYDRFLPVSDRERIRLGRSIARGRSDQVLLKARTKHGKPYHAQFKFTPVREQDSVSGVVALLYDVSDHAFDKRLENRNNDLRNVMRKHVHDMKNAMSVDTALEFARADIYSDPDSAAQWVDRSREKLQRAHEDLKGLFSWLKNASDDKPRIRDYAIDELVSAVVDQVRPEEHEYGVGIDKSLPSLRGWTDKSRYTHAVGNVLQNALKFSQRGTNVSVELGLRERAGKQYAELAVRDTGPGIPDSLRERIFEPFNDAVSMQPGVSEHIKQKSSGYGLSSAKNSLEDVYGFIEVDSVVGEGSTFRLGVPAYR